jgi:hypothetical protein
VTLYGRFWVTPKVGRPAQWRKRISEIDLATLSQTVFEDLRYRARILMRNAGVSLLFVAIALLATYLPSRRAMRVEAMATLRAN